MLDKYSRLPLNYQSKIGYVTLIQKVILTEVINLMGSTIVDLDLDLKMKIIKIKYLRNRQLLFSVL